MRYATTAVLMFTLIATDAAWGGEAATNKVPDGTLQKRPRDGHLKPEAVDKESQKVIIEAIKRFRRMLESTNYHSFYLDCCHAQTRAKVPEDTFIRQVQSVAPTLKQFFDDIIAAYESGDLAKGDFQLGRMPYPTVEGSMMIQFADRIDDTTAKRWPEGRPVRIQMAPEAGRYKFYDID